jgi:RNA recognition motif-containing protein
MSTEEEAQNAISELNGKEVDGRAINVSEAREESRDRGSFGGDNRRSFDR